VGKVSSGADLGWKLAGEREKGCGLDVFKTAETKKTREKKQQKTGKEDSKSSAERDGPRKNALSGEKRGKRAKREREDLGRREARSLKLQLGMVGAPACGSVPDFALTEAREGPEQSETLGNGRRRRPSSR
jgi:hypothetical protein